MNSHRFHLQKYTPGSKLECPACHKAKRYSRYIDEEGKIIFPDYVGRCDRENECNYHFPPREYFKQCPEAKEALKPEMTMTIIPKQQPQRTREPSFIDNKIMTATLTRYDINPLYKYLASAFGIEETNRLFSLYKIGTSKMWGGSTVFWQVDRNGNVRAGKIMAYNPETGHRIKNEQGSKMTWVHAKLGLKDFHLQQCPFGEHLLEQFPMKKVMLVEAEKTAVIASHFMPEYVWLSTGSIYGSFNETAMTVLKGRDVTLIPDLGAEEKWKAKLPILLPLCSSVTISDVLQQRATEEQKKAGLDIVDFLMSEETPQQILQRMIRRCPALQTLIDKFDLELVEPP